MGNVALMPSSMPLPGVYKTWVSGPEYTGQKPAFFNSELLVSGVDAGQNAKLTIYLRLHLVKRNVKDGIVLYGDEGKAVELRDWDDSIDEFGRFKKGVKEQAGAFWNGTNFCLVPPADYRALDFPHNRPRFRPNIDCHFQIVWAAGPSDAHAVIDCFCPKNPFAFRSNASGSYSGNGKGQWTCHDLELRGHDILVAATCEEEVGDPLKPELMTRRTVRCNKQVAHEAVCHEVGHLLGMAHVGEFFKTPDCLEAMKSKSGEGTNANACYVGRNDGDAQNIMGGGMALASWNVIPWASRLVSHTGVSLVGWNVSMRKVKPKAL